MKIFSFTGGAMSDATINSQTQVFNISGEELTFTELVYLIDQKVKIAIDEATKTKIQASSDLLQQFIKENRIIYGVNTSLGGFVNWLIPGNYAEQLQNNLIAAVATNVGTFLEDRVVKASMLARLNSLARGVSAISLTNYEKLLEMYNKGVLPCIPSKGSLGASGDLGPLACIALVAVGKWKAKYRGKILSGKEALEQAGIEPMQLSYKEGLSLINGTSTMTGFAAILVEESICLLKTYDVISCLSFEGLGVKKKPFDPTVHKQKKHRGQLHTSESIWHLLKDSQMVVDELDVEAELRGCQQNAPTSTESPIEDAYSIRCTPHILGPIKDSLRSIRTTVQNELNSSSDNPLIIPEANEVFHNGHFHGQYISMSMDHLSIGLTTLANLSDRRIDRFMDKSNSNGLPPFLCAEHPGLRLGLMGGQFMATSVTAEIRSLCTPISIQTLTSTGDFQDHVSLGLVAARRAKDIYDNVIYVLAFELLCAVQAVDIRGTPDQLSTATRAIYELVREIVPYLSTDQCITDYLEDLAQLIKSGKLLKEVESLVGEIIF